MGRPCGIISGENRSACVQKLDRAAIAELIERIEAPAPDMAKGLQTLMENFKIGRTRNLLGDVI